MLGDLDTNGELTIRFLVGSITPSHTATDLTRVIRCHGGAMVRFPNLLLVPFTGQALSVLLFRVYVEMSMLSMLMGYS